MGRSVRTSGKVVVFKDSCVLGIKLHDTDGDFYILPGGGQNAGELLPETVQREVMEETGIEVRAKDIAFVIEGSEGESFHRVDLVFLCEYLGENQEPICPDTHQVGYEWLKIDGLNRMPLYPSKLRRPIMNLYAGVKTPVYLGNECVGDPEITD